MESRQEGAPPPASRSVPMGINARTARAIRAAGLTLDDVGLVVPRKHLVVNGKQMPLPQATDRMRAQYTVDRQHFDSCIVRAVRAKSFADTGGSVSWHFGHVVEDIDFDARVATFVPTPAPAAAAPASQPPGAAAAPAAAALSSRIVAEYDLLVGADGANSVVRAKMLQRHVPGLEEEKVLENRVTYKAIGGLRPTPEMEADLPGVYTEGASETLFIMGPISDTARRCALWKRPDGTLSGILAGPPGWHTEESLRKVLDDMFPRTLRAWHEPIKAQVGPQQNAAFMGGITKVSQFHGPSTVLVGDSAHCVTPNMGQGCNAAVESALVLAQTLDRVGLEQAPAAFTEARRPDAHALQDLEYHLSLVMATGPVGIRGQMRAPTPAESLVSKLLFQVPSMLYSLVLRKLMPKVFVEPLLSNCLGANPDMRYRDVSRIYRVFGWGLPLALLAAVLGALVHAAVTVALRGGA